MCLMKLKEARDQYTFANVWIQEGKKMFKDDNKIDLNLWIQSYIGLLRWKEKLRLLFYFLFRILYETFCAYFIKHLLFNLTIENAPLTSTKKWKFCWSMFYYFKFNFCLTKHLSIFWSLQENSILHDYYLWHWFIIL